MSLLEFRNVNKSFSTDFWAPKFEALNKLSFCVDEGQITGFLGPNGAGKTTSIKTLLRFISLDSGEIILDPSLGENWQEVRNSIGYLPERPFFYPHLTGQELLSYLFSLHGLDKKVLNESVEEWAHHLKISNALNKRIKTYSKGMVQRLGFLAAIAHRPKFLILDEPLSGLDPIGRKEFKDTMRILNGRGTSIFFSSHIVSDVEEISNDVVIINKGELFYQGSIKELIHKNENQEVEIKCHYGQACDEITDIKSRKVGDEVIFEVGEPELQGFIKKLLSLNILISEIRRSSPNLEQIIYHWNLERGDDD
jgi:ABC-2 type transport system ATP-binding protein